MQLETTPCKGSTEEQTKKDLQLFLGSRLSGSKLQEIDAYIRLHSHGRAATQLILSELQRFDLTHLENQTSLQMINGLASLLHDFDNTQSRQCFDAMLSKPCDETIASVIRTVQHKPRSTYRENHFGSIRIFEDEKIEKRYNATRHVIAWLEILPEADLEGLSRIYIVKKTYDHDADAAYHPDLSLIRLNWHTSIRWYNPLYYILRVNQQLALYQEIGEHSVRNGEWQHASDKEDQAEEYGWTHVRKARPTLSFSIRWFLRPVF